MAEKEADLLVDEEDQATDAPELAIAQKKRALGTYVGAFFDELMRAGVRDVVVSPGSRSTPLSMVAHEAHARFGSAFNLYLDIDERGAAFFCFGHCQGNGACCVRYLHIGYGAGKLLSCGDGSGDFPRAPYCAFGG